MNANEKQYIGTYKVVRISEKSQRVQVIQRGLTREEAKRLVNTFPDSNTSIVVFVKQFSANKYYI